MSEATVEHQDPAAAADEAPETVHASAEHGPDGYSAAEMVKRLSPEAHDRLGSVMESVAGQLQGRNVNITYANQKQSVRISKYATALHTFLTAFDNELRNQPPE